MREYAKFRVRNTVEIGHQLGARFAVYWPGSLGYYVQGAIDEIDTLRWYAEALNAACERDIECARERNRPTLKHCLEAKPFEPQAEILLRTSDAMLAFIASGLLTHPEMVGLNPEYLQNSCGEARRGRPWPERCWQASCSTSISTTATV